MSYCFIEDDNEVYVNSFDNINLNKTFNNEKQIEIRNCKYIILPKKANNLKSLRIYDCENIIFPSSDIYYLNNLIITNSKNMIDLKVIHSAKILCLSYIYIDINKFIN